MDMCLCGKGQGVVNDWPKRSISPGYLDIKISKIILDR